MQRAARRDAPAEFVCRRFPHQDRARSAQSRNGFSVGGGNMVTEKHGTIGRAHPLGIEQILRNEGQPIERQRAFKAISISGSLPPAISAIAFSRRSRLT